MKLLNRFLFLILCMYCSSCVKQKFTAPGSTNNTDLSYPIYKTIAELRIAMGVAGAKEITENIVISGVVVADDRTGNFYKQIIIDDGTAAIPILLDANNLYNDFPIGSKIYIRCKGLYTNFYYKLPQLGFKPNEYGQILPIPFLLWKNYITKSTSGNQVKPIEVSITEVMKAKSELLNRLILIKELQVLDTLLNKVYAVPSTLSSATNIVLTDCDSNKIILRTSGFCSFQSAKPNVGKGNIVAIYTAFNNTPQLIIRDTSDIQFVNQRCF